VEPPEHVLWVTQIVRGAGGGGAWVHTHGLARCGALELEMIEVDETCLAGAAELLGAVAGRLLEESPPSPGAALEVGPGVHVALQPWDTVAAFVPDGVPGGRDDHGAAHGGARAAICAPAPAGQYREVWVWPEEAVRRLVDGTSALARSDRATARQAQLARAEWPWFVRVFATPPGAEVSFAVQAGLTAGADTPAREHLWFDVERVTEEGVEGRLAHAPAMADLAPGDERWVALDAISDWRVMTAGASFGPGDVPALRRWFESGREGTA
jgi:uncharacterized protein YegJ (DUF2314 family)